jgi:hypothetical protein
MRSLTTVYRSGHKKRRFRSFILLAMGAVLFLLSGCAEESVDEAADCQTQLDNRNFQVVADNAACSNYERGSAELSLAGFLFENFLKEDADSNFPSALNLTPTGCAITGTDAETGAYDSTYQQHFMRAQYWSRTKPADDGITRDNATIEISYFSTLGEIISETYCQVDSNLDGTITEAENLSYTKINIAGANVGSSDLDTSLEFYQIIVGGVGALQGPWLCDATDCAADLTYEGVPGAGNTETVVNLVATGDIAAVSAIVSVESLQQLFDPAASPAEISRPYDFLSMYANRANLLLVDLTALGVSEDDDLYENVSGSVGAMDNGGTCSNSSAQVLGLLTTIVQNAAPPGTTDFETYNLLNTSDIPQIDTGEGILTCPVCPAGVTMKVRLIFNDGAGGDTGLYVNADTPIAETLTNLATLSFDESGDPIPIVAGDEKIALQELLCLDE